jgi:hypothetical protein
MEGIGGTSGGMTGPGTGITRARIRNAVIIIRHIEHGGMAVGTAIHPTTQLLVGHRRTVETTGACDLIIATVRKRPKRRHDTIHWYASYSPHCSEFPLRST